MRNKINYEYVKNYIEVESNSGCKLLSNEYQNNRIKLKLECKCTRVFYKTWGDFKSSNGRQCKQCGNEVSTSRRRTSIEDLHIQIKENNYKFISFNEDFKNTKSKITVLCDKGHLIETHFHNLKSKTGCKECNKERSSKIRRNPEEKIHLLIKEKGYVFIRWVEEYKNQHSHFEIKCNKGHTSITSYISFKNHNCIYCSGKNKKTIDEIRKSVESEGYLLLSDIYENKSSKITLKCPEGHTYTTTHASWSNGGRCWYCGINKVSGENNWNWKGGVSTLQETLRSRTQTWNKNCLKEHEYKCAFTGSKENVVVHHLYSFNSIINLSLRNLNLDVRKNISDYSKFELKSIKDKVTFYNSLFDGIVFDNNIHKLFHQLYSYGNNKPSQLSDFLDRLKSGEFDDFLKYNNLCLII